MSYETASAAADLIRSKYKGDLRTAIVLGSGLGAFADQLTNAVRVPYDQIPGFARSTVEGHEVQLKDKPRLQLEHPRRIDIGKRRQGNWGTPNATDELAERRQRSFAISIDGHATGKIVTVIENIVSL